MKGILLSKKFYEEFGKPLLENDFKEVLPYIAVGFCGSGSEHYGFDDEISKDHDYEPGFCIFLPGEDIVDRKIEFKLERAYAKLPKEFMGEKRLNYNPVGGNRHGVMRIADYFTKNTGFADGMLTTEAWLGLPDYALCEAVNGEIFFDNYGEVTKIRENLKNMPLDIKYKRIAGNLLLMGQSGQYNFPRCLSHGEPEAASFALKEFVTSALKVIFLLDGGYMPYYKWAFRALRETLGEAELADKLSRILLAGEGLKDNSKSISADIEWVAKNICERLEKLDFAASKAFSLEEQAYIVNDKIADAEIRNLHILTAV